jgi:hypothetical protein
MSRYLPQWLAQCPEANADWTIWVLGVLCLIEFVLLMMLGVEIFLYADLAKGR